jgi:hypothetical protein
VSDEKAYEIIPEFCFFEDESKGNTFEVDTKVMKPIGTQHVLARKIKWNVLKQGFNFVFATNVAGNYVLSVSRSLLE